MTIFRMIEQTLGLGIILKKSLLILFPGCNTIPGMRAYEQRVSGIEKRNVHLFRMSGNGIEPCYFLTYMMENYGMKANTRLQLLTPDEMVTLCNYFLK